jgi:hypothetical protein
VACTAVSEWAYSLRLHCQIPLVVAMSANGAICGSVDYQGLSLNVIVMGEVTGKFDSEQSITSTVSASEST